MRNTELDVLIIRSGMKKFEITHSLNWHGSKLAQILNGSRKASVAEQKALCKVIGCTVDEAFLEKEAVNA